MIVFDLRCANGHVFEAWFGSGAAYDAQVAGGLVACPICGDSTIGKAVMAPNLAAKGNRSAQSAPPEAAKVKQALAALAKAQADAIAGSTWVGPRFAQEARAMHAGDAPHAPIHGQATLADARALAEEGVAVAPLPFPVVPPEARN